jgi:putative MATE family efflux protein
MDTPDDKPAVSDGPNAAGTGNTRRIDLRLRTLNGTLWRLSWPAVVENLLFSMVFFSDTLITGWLRDERMLAATALAGLLMFLMNAPFIAYSAAANSIVSRSWGEHDFLTARRCAGITVGLSILLAVLLYFAAWPFADAVVRLFGADDQVAPISGRYLRILLLSGFCGYPMMISNAVIRGTGNTRTPMLIAVLMNGTNVLFSVIFAFGWLGFPPMGVYGVAWGTVVARGVGFACSAGYMLHSRGVGVSPAFLVRGDRTMLARLWRLAWPTLAERFGNSVVYLIFMRQVAGLGTTVLAAHQIALQVESLAFMPGWAMGVATHHHRRSGHRCTPRTHRRVRCPKNDGYRRTVNGFSRRHFCRLRPGHRPPLRRNRRRCRTGCRRHPHLRRRTVIYGVDIHHHGGAPRRRRRTLAPVRNHRQYPFFRLGAPPAGLRFQPRPGRRLAGNRADGQSAPSGWASSLPEAHGNNSTNSKNRDSDYRCRLFAPFCRQVPVP